MLSISILKTFSAIEASILFNILSKLKSNRLLLELITSSTRQIKSLTKLSKTFNAIEALSLLSKSNTKHVIAVRVSLLLKSFIESISISRSRRLLL